MALLNRPGATARHIYPRKPYRDIKPKAKRDKLGRRRGEMERRGERRSFALKRCRLVGKRPGLRLPLHGRQAPPVESFVSRKDINKERQERVTSIVIGG